SLHTPGFPLPAPSFFGGRRVSEDRTMSAAMRASAHALQLGRALAGRSRCPGAALPPMARGRATALGPILPVGELEEAWARLEERRQTPAPWSSSRPRRVAPGRSTRCCAGPGERDAGVGAREPLPPESVAAARRPDE
ncbi:unnamed protein product, partial [Prorocentrum cordatum]